MCNIIYVKSWPLQKWKQSRSSVPSISEDDLGWFSLLSITDKFKITSSALSETKPFSSSSDSSESVSQGFFFFPPFPTLEKSTKSYQKCLF